MDGCVNQYSAAFKARVRRRLVGPQAVSANRLSSDVGVSAELGALLRREGLHAAPPPKPRWGRPRGLRGLRARRTARAFTHWSGKCGATIAR